MQAPQGDQAPGALFPFSNHKDYCLATLKIWADCGICTLETGFRQEVRPTGVARRKLAQMVSEGDSRSGLTGKEPIPHKVAMTGQREADLIVDQGSTCASAGARHALRD
jgi:hypothetical protein